MARRTMGQRLRWYLPGMRCAVCSGRITPARDARSRRWYPWQHVSTRDNTHRARR